MSNDYLNGEATDAVCRLLRPADYDEGRGLSAAGKKVEAQLYACDSIADSEPSIACDTSWMNPRGMYNVS